MRLLLLLSSQLCTELCAVISRCCLLDVCCWRCRLHDLLSRNSLVDKFIAELSQFDQPNIFFKVSPLLSRNKRRVELHVVVGAVSVNRRRVKLHVVVGAVSVSCNKRRVELHVVVGTVSVSRLS